MPHFEELYPGRFLKGVTLAKPINIMILAFVPEALEGDDGKKQPKAILKYKDSKGYEGEMVCCKTNAALIAAMYGPDYTQWIGKLITLHFDPKVRFGAEKPGGIRIMGSPSIPQSLTVELKRPRRKSPDVYLLQPTGKPAGQEQDKKKAEPTPASAEQILIWQSHLQEPTDMDALTTAWDRVRTQPMSKAQLDDLSRLYMAQSAVLRGQRA